MYKLLNCDDHVGFLSKKKRDPSHARPDIAHQCMMSLLDSPLNKAGLLKLYVHTQTNVIIDVNPKIRIPRTFKRFSGLMVQLLHKLSIKAEGVRGEPVLKLVKGPVTKYFPPNATVIGTSFSAEKLVDIFEFVPSLYNEKEGKNTSEEDEKEPQLKKIKVEQIDSDEENEKEEEVKLEEEQEEELKSENDSDNGESDDEDEEEGEGEEADVVDEPPQNFDVNESFTFTNILKNEEKRGERWRGVGEELIFDCE